MSLSESVYIIPCLCGNEVRSHAPAASCSVCGRLLDVQGWGRPPTPQEEQEARVHFSTRGSGARGLTGDINAKVNLIQDKSHSPAADRVE